MNAEEIIGIRLKLGITQAQLAKLTGADVRTVQNWEKRGTDSKTFVRKLREINTKEREILDAELKAEAESVKTNPYSDYDYLEALRVSQAQTTKCQEQMDRFIAIIEQLMHM